MLTRVSILWAVFAAVMGFIVGGSVVWSFQYEPHYKTDQASKQNADQNISSNSIEKTIWKPNDPVSAYTLVLAIFTGLLVAVSAIQIGFLIRADKITRRSADAAKAAADIAKSTLIASQRAWIRIDGIGLDGFRDLEFDENGVRTVLSVYATNVGNVPALNVTVRGRLVVLDKRISPPTELQKLSDEIRAKPFGIGFTLFPGDKMPDYLGGSSLELLGERNSRGSRKRSTCRPRP
jgi:hypothetical protein